MFWEQLAQEVKHARQMQQKKEEEKRSKKKVKLRQIPGFWVSFRLVDVIPIYFTGREIQCLKQLIKGRNMRDIAKRLKLSPRTIEYYMRNIREKARCYTTLQLVELMKNSTLVCDRTRATRQVKQEEA